VSTCERCGEPLTGEVPGWCHGCGTGTRIAAASLLEWLLPEAARLPTGTLDADPLTWPDYPARRTAARESTGSDESVVTAVGRIRGSDVETVAVVWEFGFLGGSMSSGAGRLISEAYDAARERRLPLLLLPSTGGARMQEGMASLVQMAATSVAALRHAEAGLLQVTVVRDPTTGGVFASHANLADVVLAEPHATVGFAGPRVAEAMTGGPLPAGSHTSRGAQASGLVDEVVPRPDLPAVLARVLAWPGRAEPAEPPTSSAAGADDAPPTHDRAWDQVLAARAEDRARAPRFLEALDVAVELHGDRAGGDDPSIRAALARLHGRPVVVVAMDRTGEGGRTRPTGYRKAWRAFRLADRLGVPVVTLVDTPGADASAASEAGGIAHHIARTFTELLSLEVPTVALVTGEGGSGGALALAVTDELLLQEHAVFSVIAPEGAAAILHRDASRAPEVAELLDPTAQRLVALGLADGVVPEPAGGEVAAAWEAVAAALDRLVRRDQDERRAARLDRWRHAAQD
jgi:acetyl-CoA carboxylase carboxyl transferase alpha subunit